jgi:hypothetical protein
MPYIDLFIIPSRLYMFRAMFQPIIRSTWLYLQYLVVTFLLLPTWYTNFFFIHTNYIKLNSSTCFVAQSPHHQEVNDANCTYAVSCIVTLYKWPSCATAKFCLSGRTRRSLADSDDTRGGICTICVVDLLMMGGLRSKYVEEFHLM